MPRFDPKQRIVDCDRRRQDPINPGTDPTDLRLVVDHIFSRKEPAKLGLEDVADHMGNYRPAVMHASRKKSGRMPDQGTDFFGRNRGELEPLYQTALANLNRKASLAFRDARLRLIQTDVTSVLGLAKELKEVGT